MKEMPPQSPKNCPCGHSHISWTHNEAEVYCWDCDRSYPLEQCFGGSEDVAAPGRSGDLD